MGASEPDGGPALRTGIWVAMALATLIVVLRVFAKLKIGQFHVDDILMIIAMVCALTHPYTNYRCWPLPYLKVYVN